MKGTDTFYKTLQAYLDGYRLISNRGSSRSGKSFAIMQLISLITENSSTSKVITCVSMTSGHLETGIIRDFEHILEDRGVVVSDVRTQRPNRYKLGKCVVEFLSLDKPR